MPAKTRHLCFSLAHTPRNFADETRRYINQEKKDIKIYVLSPFFITFAQLSEEFRQSNFLKI